MQPIESISIVIFKMIIVVYSLALLFIGFILIYSLFLRYVDCPFWKLTFSFGTPKMMTQQKLNTIPATIEHNPSHDPTELTFITANGHTCV